MNLEYNDALDELWTMGGNMPSHEIPTYWDSLWGKSLEYSVFMSGKT